MLFFICVKYLFQ